MPGRVNADFDPPLHPERRVLCSLLVCGNFTWHVLACVVMEAGLLAIFLARTPGKFESCVPAVVHPYVAKSYLFAICVAVGKVLPAVFAAFS